MLDPEDPPGLVFDWRDLAPLGSLRFGGPAETSLVLHIVRQLLVVAGRLHTRGILHLAINPFNVLAQLVPGEGSRPKVFLSGFGHAISAGDFQGKSDYRRFPDEFIPYLSPEHTGRTGLGPDERSDYYSIGAVLYELIAGTAPFPVGDVEETVYAILATPPIDLQSVRGDIPLVLASTIMRLLAKDPEDRYQSAGEILRDLNGGSGRFATRPRQILRPGPFMGTIGPVGSRFVGRDRERALLEEARARARRGEPTVLTVSGSPGPARRAWCVKSSCLGPATSSSAGNSS